MKNIILCFDGTNNKFGPAPFTNVLKIFRLFDRDDPKTQICHYQPGIGASMLIENDEVTLNLDSIKNSLDSMIAFTLDVHICEAYRYLMRFYEEGDKIYMFGFSRGAFTARVLCSMIDRVGLLNSGLEELVEGAWYLYSTWEYAAQPSQPDYTSTLVDEFVKTFSRSTPPLIEFLGLFDSVNSVGIIRDRMFPFTSKLKSVKQVRHAVSLDERRVKHKQNLIFPNPYKPSLFVSRKASQRTSRSSSVIGSKQNSRDPSQKSSSFEEASRMSKEIEHKLHAFAELRRAEGSYASTSTFSILNIDKKKLLSGEFQELWFPGDHGDVGGGWEPDMNGQFVSNLALRWIIAEAIKAGVHFKKRRVVEFAQRYSSLDSFLSCTHDTLALNSNSLTHEIPVHERTRILKLSNSLTRTNKSDPYFKSSDIPTTFKGVVDGENRLFKNMNQVTFELDSENRSIGDFNTISQIFSHHKSLPEEQIQGTDGRGSNSLLGTLVWWLLELLPLASKVEDETDGHWKNSLTPNFGRSRVLPRYATLHWSIFWRQMYCYDYSPDNLPDYIEELLLQDPGEFESVMQRGEFCGDDDLLLKKIKDETRQKFKVWRSQNWKVVPDDLIATLEDFGYFDEE